MFPDLETRDDDFETRERECDEAIDQIFAMLGIERLARASLG